MRTLPRIDGFEFLSELGSGAMGSVYIANQLRLDRKVAIKVLHSNLASDPGLVARFEREARTLARLRHENIVSVIDYGVAKGSPYIVMDYIEGVSLYQALTGKPLQPDEAIQILSQVATALDCAHAAGVIHRDVKPANILYQRDGKVLLTDFGIAKNSDSTGMTNTGMSLGTPLYMAPEVCRGQVATAASDLYALGVMAYELLTGKRPFDGSDPFAVIAMHVNQSPPDPRKLAPGLPSGVGEFFALAMAKEPERRFKSAGALVAGLRQAVAPRTTQTRSPQRSKALPIALASVLLLGVAAVIVALNGSGGAGGGGAVSGKSIQAAVPARAEQHVPVLRTESPAPFPKGAEEAFQWLIEIQLEIDREQEEEKRPYARKDFRTSYKSRLDSLKRFGNQLIRRSSQREQLFGYALLCAEARLLMDYFTYYENLPATIAQAGQIRDHAKIALTLDGEIKHLNSVKLDISDACQQMSVFNDKRVSKIYNLSASDVSLIVEYEHSLKEIFAAIASKEKNLKQKLGVSK